MTNEEITKDTELVVNKDELTEEQKLAMQNLEKLFNIKVKAALEAILDGVAAKYQRKQSKIKKRKDSKVTRYEQGWLDATKELFNGIYSFLYALEVAGNNAVASEVETTPEDFDIFEAIDNLNNEGETNE